MNGQWHSCDFFGFFLFIIQIKLLRYFWYSNTTDLLNICFKKFFTEKCNILKGFKAVFAFECGIRIYRKNCKKINTVNQLLFAWEKFVRGSQGPCRREYFSPQITLYCMVVKTRRVWISRSRIHLSSRTRLLDLRDRQKWLFTVSMYDLKNTVDSLLYAIT